MKTINPSRVIQEKLAAGMGLDKYAFIEEQIDKVDISADNNFQKIFNGFYRVRRNEEWRKHFYKLFEKAKHSGKADFSYLLDEMYRLTGNVEASFVSKMVATLNPQMPIWDKYVVQNLQFKFPAISDPERIQKVKEIYMEIVLWYDSFLKTDNAKECLQKFDEILPDYVWLSDVKKIDFYLWSIRQ